jgi:hypothetical protein
VHCGAKGPHTLPITKQHEQELADVSSAFQHYVCNMLSPAICLQTPQACAVALKTPTPCQTTSPENMS